MRTENDQLALGICAVIERLVETVSSPEPDWAGTIDRFASVVSTHQHTGILSGKTPSTMILWNTGFLMVRKLEASPADPALWERAVMPLEVLAVRMGIDIQQEFAALHPEDDQ